MSETNKALGGPVPFLFEGVDYLLSPLTYDDQANFEVFLETRAVRALQRHRKEFSDDEYRKNFLDLIADITIGRYSFGGDECAKSAKGVPGLKELFFLSIVKKHPELKRDFVDRVFESKALEATTTVSAANADPFSKATADPVSP